VVLVGTTANQLLAFDSATGSSLWKMTAPAPVGAGASVVNGTVFWGYGFVLIGPPGNDGGVIALRPSSAGGTTTTRAAQQGEGAQIFRTSCASCHGIDGRGATGPSLRGVADRLTLDQHRQVVEGGRNQMPPFANVLTEAEIDAVIDFERNGLERSGS
jgi:mono/diheme cytochrome c family protein